jgi:hypothetical protein
MRHELRETNGTNKGSRSQASGSVFPPDAHALIYQPARSSMTSGKANTRQWRLCFERRSSPYLEPLMGWTADDNPLAQVELSFTSADEAIGYARRQGLPYTILTPPRRQPDLKVVPGEGPSRRRRLEWVERTLGPDLMRSGVSGADPATLFLHPRDVVSSQTMSYDEKRQLLYRWAYDSYLLERADPDSSRLNDVMDAILDLDRAQADGERRRRRSAA